MNNIIFVNKHSGSFDNDAFENAIQSIKCKCKSVEKHVGHYTHEMINQESDESGDTLFIVITQHANHARELSSMINLEKIQTVFIAGGDGMVHEVVNGINNNNTYTERITFSVIPLGSGNHLSKALNIKSIDDWNKSLDDMKITKVFPTVIYTKEKKQILSINTIIGGMPQLINDTSSHISKYIPRFAGWLKYDISTLYNMFLKFDNNITLHYSGDNDGDDDEIKNENNEISVHNIIAIFIQTTQSCGSDLVISKHIKPDQQNVSFSYFPQHSKFRILYEFVKEKFGYESKYMTRMIDKYSVIYLEGSGSGSGSGSNLSNVTVDGQNEKISVDSKIMIKKSLESFNFICLL
jgi:diacylglycerol kinase family enzyme